MNLLTGDLGPTETYTRREYVVLAGMDFGDGRDATVVLTHFTSKSRLGRKWHQSRYAVSEVRQVGFAGRVFVWDKEKVKGMLDEHGPPRPGDRLPPYTVRIDQYGEIRCECMAGACKAPTCRHADATLVLIDEKVFSEPPQGA